MIEKKVGFFPLKRESSDGTCPNCYSDNIKEKHSELEKSFMKPYMNAKLYENLCKDRVCLICDYIWIEKS